MVESPTLKSPNNNFKIASPTKGIAENKLVITVAPQYDICPQGSV